jgi:hypothetical protein
MSAAREGGSGKGRGWLWGCGAGCVVLLFAALAITGSCFMMLRGMMTHFETASEADEELARRFGDAEAFTPWPDGVPPAPRIEAFLAVREASQPARAELAQVLGGMPLDGEKARELERQTRGEKLRTVLGLTRSVMGLGGKLGALFEARNRALLDAGMGLGEYRYIHLVAYAANPAPRREPDRAGREEGLALLRRQLEALPAQGPPETGVWRERLAAEVRALEADDGRRPWQDGLPEPIAAALAPYRARLDATYAAATAGFELGRTKQRGSFSFSVE